MELDIKTFGKYIIILCILPIVYGAVPPDAVCFELALDTICLVPQNNTGETVLMSTGGNDIVINSDLRIKGDVYTDVQAGEGLKIGTGSPISSLTGDDLFVSDKIEVTTDITFGSENIELVDLDSSCTGSDAVCIGSDINGSGTNMVSIGSNIEDASDNSINIGADHLSNGLFTGLLGFYHTTREFIQYSFTYGLGNNLSCFNCFLFASNDTNVLNDSIQMWDFVHFLNNPKILNVSGTTVSTNLNVTENLTAGFFQSHEGTPLGFHLHSENDDLHLESNVEGNNYFGLSTDGAFLQLYANPNPSNDYLLFTVSETQGADTEVNFYEGGTGHNRFWDSGSMRIGGGEGYLCSELTDMVDCDTPSTGADLVLEDDMFMGGALFMHNGSMNITENNITTTNWQELWNGTCKNTYIGGSLVMAQCT